MRLVSRLLVSVFAAVAVAGAGLVVDAQVRDADAAEVLGPGAVEVTIDITNSRFEVEDLLVRPMTDVTFVLVNHDPIHHELIVGGPDVHDRHRHGTEAEHPPVPGEVSVGPNETAETTYHFHEGGTVEFACHLPGHYDYGMLGHVKVLDG